MFSTKLTTPDESFGAALKTKTEGQRQPPAGQVPITVPAIMESRVLRLNLANSAANYQSLRAPLLNSETLDSMLRVVTVVEQIMIEVNGAVSEEDKIVAINKTVLNFMKQSGH
jgi:hypothetical protein